MNLQHDGLCPRCHCCVAAIMDCWRCEGLGSRDDPWTGEVIGCDVCDGTGEFWICRVACDEHGRQARRTSRTTRSEVRS